MVCAKAPKPQKRRGIPAQKAQVSLVVRSNRMNLWNQWGRFDWVVPGEG